MSDEENLKTHKPTCGSGEPSLHDEEILEHQARLLREKKKPIKAFHTVPLVLVFIFGGIIFWAGLAISQRTGFWSSSISDVNWSKTEALALYAKEAAAGGSAGPSAAFKKGKKLYNTPGACVTCHQPNGQGLPPANFPPLVESEWVTGSEEVVVRIVLNGLQGPVTVGGKEYGLVPMVPTIWKTWSDDDIAAVISYVRNAWGNQATEVSADTVKKIRSEVGERSPWTVGELEAYQK